MAFVKPGVRVVGIDDASYNEGDAWTELIGVAMARNRVEGIGCSGVRVDGRSANGSCKRTISRAAVGDSPAVVFVDGITVGGLTMIDIPELASDVGAPVIAVNRKRPDTQAMHMAFDAVADDVNRKAVMEAAGEYVDVAVDGGSLFIQWSGCSEARAEAFVERAVFSSIIPESVRIADMIGAGVCGGDCDVDGD